MSKSEFIRSLQGDDVVLTPYEISQRIRKKHGCCSRYRGDPGLNVAHYRGYMVRYAKPDRSPENPEWYECVISLGQSKQWQDLVWTKEILGILDGPDHWTKNKELLGHMIDSRAHQVIRSVGTPLNVTADKDGLILALGCAIPLGYRQTLRDQRSLEKNRQQLEAEIMIPAEFIDAVLGPPFEDEFERALAACDQAETARVTV